MSVYFNSLSLSLSQAGAVFILRRFFYFWVGRAGERGDVLCEHDGR